MPSIKDADEQLLTHSHALGLRNVTTATSNLNISYPCQFINDAIFSDGVLYKGDNLRAGEFGHNTLVPGGRLCYCGKQGCLDAYCSAKVLSDYVDGNLPLFFEHLQMGDTVMQRVWDNILMTLLSQSIICV